MSSLGENGVESFAGLDIAAAAVELSRLRLEGTKLGITATASSLLPPGSEMASMKALAQQQASIVDFLTKMSKGTQNLGYLSSLTRNYNQSVQVQSEEAAAAISQIES